MVIRERSERQVDHRLLDKLGLEEEILERFRTDQLALIAPNTKQWQFICTRAKETIFPGPAQTGGKTTALLIRCSYDIPGTYPDEYDGPRFDHPIKFCLGGATGATTRDLMTDRLLGPKDARGHGMLPIECVDEKLISYMHGGVKEQIDKFKVRWLGPSGIWDGHSYSEGWAFSYASGWKRMRGYPMDAAYPDEEPPMEVYDELSARLNYKRGIYLNSMIPEEGDTPYYLMFEKATQQGDGTGKLLMEYTIHDCTHLTEEHKQEQLTKYALHPRAETFLMGRPVRSEGLIYKQPIEELVIDDFRITDQYEQIIGLDFPYTTGAFAAVRLARDLGTGVVYLTGCYKSSRKERVVYARAVENMGGDKIPCAWPSDGGRDVDSRPMFKVYKDLGLNMLKEAAHYVVDGNKKSVKTWPAIDEIIDRCAEGTFKIFRSCQEYIEERARYRSDKGQIKSNQDDHLIDASHKAIMMLRHARRVDSREEQIVFSRSPRDFFSPSRGSAPRRGGRMF